MVRAPPDQTAMGRSNNAGSSLDGAFFGFFKVFFENEENPIYTHE